MRYLVCAMLVIVAIIHLLPLSGVFGSERLTSLYGISFDEPDIAILMRHRAVLFGLLGLFLLVAAFIPRFQVAAFVVGFVFCGERVVLVACFAPDRIVACCFRVDPRPVVVQDNHSFAVNAVGHTHAPSHSGS